MKRKLSLGAAMAVVVAAVAGLALAAADKENPLQEEFEKAGNAQAVLADMPLEINIQAVRDNTPIPDKVTGYTLRFYGRVYGMIKDGDALDIDIMKEKKVLTTLHVDLKATDTSNLMYSYSFNFDKTLAEADKLEAVGDLRILFNYTDFATEKKRLLAEKRITVVKKGDVDSGEGKHIWSYGIVYKDLPASSYAFLAPQTWTTGGQVRFYAWANVASYNFLEPRYKITVDGNAVDIPNGFSDFGAEALASVQQEETMYDFAKGNIIDNDYNWYQFWFKPKLYWGPADKDLDDKGWIGLVKHPGAWSFKIYSGGKMVRELRFTVTADGRIAPHPEQDATKPGALNLGPSRYFVETFFPKELEWDLSFDPDSCKKTGFYGRPWIGTELKGMMDELPGKKSHVFPATKLPPDKKKK